MHDICQVELNGGRYDLPVVEGTEHERAIDISSLRNQTGYITLDDGFANTASCTSAITFADGEQGILRYRGIPVEDLAENSSFAEVTWLVIFGRLPGQADQERFSALLTESSMFHQSMLKHLDAFPSNAAPMATLSAMINTLSLHEPPGEITDEAGVERAAAHLISKVRTIAAASYKFSIGEPAMYPHHDYTYCQNFLHMMFSLPFKEHIPTPEAARILELFLVLHADHEQNCSTSTVRMVASSKANMFASCAAGVCALWGPLHGGANVAVIEMLQHLYESGMKVAEYLKRIKAEDSRLTLAGFGHRVYRSFDPRARILKRAAYQMLDSSKLNDPLLDIALELEQTALSDPYFIERELYPNVELYSGIILRSLGIPLNMFTVMSAIGRMPGWIANWKEIHDDPRSRIYRPRQIYVGNPLTEFVPRSLRRTATSPVAVGGPPRSVSDLSQ